MGQIREDFRDIDKLNIAALGLPLTAAPPRRALSGSEISALKAAISFAKLLNPRADDFRR
jgi:hypothetical protein